MSLSTEQAADIAEMMVDLPRVFTFNSVDYACLPTFRGIRTESQDGGFLNEHDLSLTSLVSAFAALPALPDNGQKLIFDGVTYRIDKASVSQTGVEVRFDCVTPDN